MNYSRLSNGATYQYLVLNDPGTLSKVVAMNNGNITYYLKIYDLAALPAPAADTPILRYMLNPHAVVNIDMDVVLADGLGVVVVAGAVDTDVTQVAASEVMFNIDYSSASISSAVATAAVVHVVIIGMKLVDSLGGILDKESITIAQRMSSTSELRIYEDAVIPSSTGYPTIKTYIEREAVAGYVLGHISQNYVITYRG